MAIPDPSVTDWVPIWHPESAGAQGPPGATGPIGPQGPAGINGTAAPHQTTHQVGGTDELVNNAWRDKDNNFTVGQHINTINANIVLNDTGAPVDNKIFRILSGNGSLFISALNDAQSAVMGEVFMNRTGSINTGLGGVFAGGGFAGPNYNFVSSVDISNPTVLDHYEEGTWTPVFLTDSVNGSGQVYSSQVGKYTRIGNTVHVDFQVTISNVGTGYGGTLYVSGFPFANNGLINTIGYIGYFSGLGGNVINIHPIIFPGTGSVALYYKNTVSSATDGILNYAGNLINGTSMQGGITYLTN